MCRLLHESSLTQESQKTHPYNPLKKLNPEKTGGESQRPITQFDIGSFESRGKMGPWALGESCGNAKFPLPVALKVEGKRPNSREVTPPELIFLFEVETVDDARQRTFETSGF